MTPLRNSASSSSTSAMSSRGCAKTSPVPSGTSPSTWCASLPVWRCGGYGAEVRYVKDAMLTFDIADMSERMATNFDATIAPRPGCDSRRTTFGPWSNCLRTRSTIRILDATVRRWVGDGDSGQALPRRVEQANDARAWLHGSSVVSWSTSMRICLTPSHWLTWPFSRALAMALQSGVQSLDRRGAYRWQLEARTRRAQNLLLDTQPRWR